MIAKVLKRRRIFLRGGSEAGRTRFVRKTPSQSRRMETAYVRQTRREKGKFWNRQLVDTTYQFRGWRTMSHTGCRAFFELGQHASTWLHSAGICWRRFLQRSPPQKTFTWPAPSRLKLTRRRASRVRDEGARGRALMPHLVFVCSGLFFFAADLFTLYFSRFSRRFEFGCTIIIVFAVAECCTHHSPPSMRTVFKTFHS